MINTLYQTIGWLGAFLFATCAIPQVIQTWETKKTEGLSFLYLLLLLFGEFFMLAYIIYEDLVSNTIHFPLYVNYVSNFILVFYLVYAKSVYK